MVLPFFYITQYDAAQKQVVLNEETSKHIVQVLRMRVGEQLNLTDGKGSLLTCEITDDNKKSCIVNVQEIKNQKPKTKNVSIAISLLKNTNRFEWFLEKATEIGVSVIIPLICERTEKERFRQDRMQGIVISAMLQSQQTWLPFLHEPTQFDDFTMRQFDNQAKYIAHCINEDSKQQLTNQPLRGTKQNQLTNQLILIGPEGDFTPNEIELALQHQFILVSLGETRLRTETAGVVAATLLCLHS